MATATLPAPLPPPEAPSRLEKRNSRPPGRVIQDLPEGTHVAKCDIRGPRAHINMTISHSGSTARYRGDARNCFVDPNVYVFFLGPFYMRASGAAPRDQKPDVHLKAWACRIYHSKTPKDRPAISNYIPSRDAKYALGSNRR